MRLQNRFAVAAYSIVFSFATYFCMYAFRKPFTVGRFDADEKMMFILAQVLGYTLSKFVGIKLIAESKPEHRGRRILVLMTLAWIALVGFALKPSAIFLFLNGIPLGMIWGLVVSYIEGRKLSTLYGVTLSASFIVSSGVAKSVGEKLLAFGVPDRWMPALAAALFFPPLFFSVKALDRLPPPTAEDEAARVKRMPMLKQSRRAFLARYWFPIAWLTMLYMLLTAYRDFRDNFAREIWDDLGYGGRADIYSTTELPIALFVLLLLGSLVLIPDAKKSFRAMFVLMVLGVMLIGGSTFAFEQGAIASPLWMTAVGVGLFVAYIPFGCIFYDDLIAATGFVGTAGFMIYVSDAFGYLGSIGVLLYKSFGHAGVPWLRFFATFSYVTSAFCAGAFLLAWLGLSQFGARSRTAEGEVAS